MKKARLRFSLWMMLMLLFFVFSGCQDSDDDDDDDDTTIPINAAEGVSFTDTDIITRGQIGGDITITRAINEGDVTHYNIYWGSDESTVKDNTTLIASLKKTGNDLTYTISDDTSTDGASHLLVFTKNSVGEMETGVSVAITDNAVPEKTASGIDFTDIDGNADEYAGTVTITEASDETYITHYALYWGKSSTEKIDNNSLITEIPISGMGNVTHDFPVDTTADSTPSHLLVFTKNSFGEMSSGINLVITDRTNPYRTASDVTFDGDQDIGDCGQMNGTVTITKAIDENDFDNYLIYWGSDTQTKNISESTEPIITIDKDGTDTTGDGGSGYTWSITYTGYATIDYSFSNLHFPTDQNPGYFLIFTANTSGDESDSIVSVYYDEFCDI